MRNTVLFLILWLFMAAESLGPSDCVTMPACATPHSEHVGSNETVLIAFDNCCWNKTMSSVVVSAVSIPAQRIVVSLRRVVALNLTYLVNVVDTKQNVTRFPATSGWGFVDVAIFDSYIQLASDGALFRGIKSSAVLISISTTGAVFNRTGISISPTANIRTSVLLHLVDSNITTIRVDVFDTVVLSSSADNCFLMYGHTIAGLGGNTRASLSVLVSSSLVNISAVSVARGMPNSFARQSLLYILSSFVTGNVSLLASSLDIKSNYQSGLVWFDESRVDELRLTIQDAAAAVSSHGYLHTAVTVRDAAPVTFVGTNLTNSLITLENFNVTMTVAPGVTDPASYSNVNWIDASLVTVRGTRNCNITLRRAYVRIRAIGGDIAPTAGYTPQTTLQLAGVVVRGDSPFVQDVSIVLDEVRFEVYVEATSSATVLLNRGFLQMMYLVQVASTATDVTVSVTNCQLLRWSAFLNHVMFFDSRTTVVVGFVDPRAAMTGAKLLTVTRVEVAVVNVSVACMDSEWADTALLGLSGTHFGSRVSVRRVTSHRLTPDSAPLDFRSDAFALQFGARTWLQPAAEAAALLWTAVAFTGPLVVGGGSVFTFAELHECRLSRFVSPNYMRYGFGTSLFAPSSLSVPSAAFFACNECVFGSSFSVGLSPLPANAPAVRGMKAPVVALSVEVTNATIASPLLVAYFNDSEVTSIGSAPGTFNDRRLIIDCSIQYPNGSLNRYVVEVSSAVQESFNVTYNNNCHVSREPQPTFVVATSAPLSSSAFRDHPESVTTAVVVTLAVGGILQGVKPLFLQVSMLSLLLAGSDGCVPVFDAVASPTMMFIASASASDLDAETAVVVGMAQGAVVGNVVLLVVNFVVWLLFGIGAVALDQTRFQIGVSQWNVKHLVAKAFSKVALPGVLICSFGFLLQPTVEASVFLLIVSRSHDSVMIFLGVCGAVGMAALCVLVLLALVTIPCSCIPRRTRRETHHFVSKIVVVLTEPLYRWVPRPPTSSTTAETCSVKSSAPSSMQYLQQYGPLFECYRGGRAVWFVGIELLVPVACGSIAGAADAIGCGVSAKLLLGFAAFVFVISIICRPFVSRLEDLNFSLGAALTVVCSALVVGGCESAAADVATLQLVLSVGMLLASWASTVRYGTSRLWNLLRSICRSPVKDVSILEPQRRTVTDALRIEALTHLISMACAQSTTTRACTQACSSESNNA